MTDANDVARLKTSRLFDSRWYLEHANDAWIVGTDPFDHYMTVGWTEGRDPSPFFNTSWYLATYLDIAKALKNPLLHYFQQGELEGRWPCRVFDPVWYSREYDLPYGEGRALEHYLTVGHRLDLQPNELFDPLFYKKSHEDLNDPEVDAALHYLHHGFRENRQIGPGRSLRTYREDYLGGQASIDPVHHFLTMGKRRGLRFAGLAGRPSSATEIRNFTNAGPEFEEFDPEILDSKTPAAKLIAFYLPQFHQIPENDAWWGAGFTEWRNTQRGVPRFAGHYQPRIPRDLGFYDLSNSCVLKRQIEMAQQAGIFGFCFYYYNFNGKRVLERPIEQFLTDPSLNFPFCIMWANENWTRRWDGHSDDVLLEQSYRPEDEDALLADWCRHFADPRYIKADGRPLLLIYRPGIIPNAAETIARWRKKFASDFGQEPWLLMSQSFGDSDPREFNLDGAYEFPPHKLAAGLPDLNARLVQLDSSFTGTVMSYGEMIERSLSELETPFPLIRACCPSWDNDCHRQGAGLTLHGSSPTLYQRWLTHLVEHARKCPFAGEPFIFVNAWNEWAEAAYLEPDVYYGGAYLNATARALVDGQEVTTSPLNILLVGHDAHPHGAQLNLLHLGRRLKHRFGFRVTWLLLEGGDLLDSYREVGPVTVARPESEQVAELLDALRSTGGDYAVTNTLVAGNVVPALRRAGFRVVSLVHELPGLAAEYQLEAEAKAIAQHSHEIVFAAQMVERGFQQFAGEPQGSMHILPQGIYAKLDYPGDAREEVRSELGLPRDAKIVIGVGFGDLRKGIDLFLQAAELAARHDQKIAFLWVGRIHENIEHWLLSGGGVPANFRHVGFTKAIARYLNAADAMFLPSREDPFPSVVLEGLACGLPVVGFADRSGSEDLMREHGAVVPAFDLVAAVEALRRLTSLDGEAAAQAAVSRRETIARDFDYDRFAFRLLQLLNPKWQSVSVIVPNYNYARYLRERLDSVFAQTVPIFEVIVLDDASTDDSLAVIERLRREYDRDFTLVANATNTGSAISQWLKGIERASGDLVWIAEADDIAKPNFLERLLVHFQNGQTLFAFSDSAQIDSNGVQLGDSYHFYYKQSRADDLTRSQSLNARTFAEQFLSVRNLILNVSAVVARREPFIGVLKENIDRLLSYSFAGDWHLYALVCLEEGNVAYLAESLNTHRRHPTSATHVAKGRAHIAEVERVHSFLAKAYGVGDDIQRLRERYIEVLREQFGLGAESRDEPTTYQDNETYLLDAS